MNKEPNKLRDWREDFKERFFNKESYLFMGDEILDFVSSLLKQDRQRLVEAVGKMFSVYPDGGIHDFKDDEELISKRQVINLIEEQ